VNNESRIKIVRLRNIIYDKKERKIGYLFCFVSELKFFFDIKMTDVLLSESEKTFILHGVEQNFRQVGNVCPPFSLQD
jgi:hypothetical protein